MSSTCDDVDETERGRTTSGTARLLGLLLMLLAVGPTASTPALADDDAAQDVWEALTKGTPKLNVRGRIELAQGGTIPGTGGALRLRSEAYTVRTRLGYGTKPYHGVNAYAEFENVASATTTSYFDPTNPFNPWLTPIAEPPGTEFNQGYLALDRPDWLGSSAIGGRQQIVLDDSRFIGDVAWRQNMQTYDAAYVQTSAGIDGLTARYGWLGHVNRIFGGGGTNPVATDFDSNSHIVNVGFTKRKEAKLVGFVYLLDLVLPFQPTVATQNANSSKTFGLRATGTIDLAEKLHLLYQGSYAYQSNYGAKTIDYGANYGLADLGAKWDGIGTVGAAFELLGTDATKRQQFQTPLATLHKFNGWADVFVNNGGPGGLRDFHAYVVPKLPWSLRMRLVYHRFWSDANGAVLGNEFDAALGRSFGKYFDLLFKSAYFVSAPGSAVPTTWRVWFDATIEF